VGTFLAGKELTDQLKPAPGSSDNTPRFISSIVTHLTGIQDFFSGMIQV